MIWIAAAAVTLILLLGSRARPVASARWTRPNEGNGLKQTPCSIRFATFNIHGARGKDGMRRPERIADDLEGVDIAALQEVHDSWLARRQLLRIEQQLGLKALNAPARRRWFRYDRNNALLSRFPVLGWSREPLPSSGADRRFRNLTVAQIDAGQPIWVLFTHLSRRSDRPEQLRQVIDGFMSRSPCVLLGDLNTVRSDPQLQALLRDDDVIDAIGEFGDGQDPDRIDWILIRGLRVMASGTSDSGASDHPLYWCDVSLD